MGKESVAIMKKLFNSYEIIGAVLTNGEISLPIHTARNGCGVYPPPGVIVGQDCDGHMYINGKRAHIKHIVERTW